ncbi:MAG: subtype B tannase [Cruoricaptor ignavus]|nr:subtype B tannase [Cruoricaptor ignavus]
MMKTNLFFAVTIAFSLSSCKTQEADSTLRFNKERFEKQTISVNENTINIRAYENIVYVKSPIDTTYQKMNIYIPEAYFEGKSIEGYTADSAPIFFPNQVGGYMPANPGTAINNRKGPMQNSNQPTTIAIALSKGYIVASAGARGRTSANGKAPAVIVDLKAAIRYLKYNDKNMPGNAEKIISNGTSAGGAVSTLLGATGNAKDYEPYLKELGAATTSDAIFAVSAYCPITNLNNADAAYEWQFYGINDYEKMDISMVDYHVERKLIPGRLDKEQEKTSLQLSKLFPSYVNSLQLKNNDGSFFNLDEKGNGTFKDLVKFYIIASANKAIASGTDMQQYTFLKMENEKVTDFDFEGYIRYLGRGKTPPAFDGLSLENAENQLFGDSETDKKHFTEYSLKNTIVQSSIANADIIKMMNPMDYIGKQGADISKHWRIRHGTKDKDTGLAIPILLATLLQNNGYPVDFALPWDKPHSGDYDLDELFEWMKQISK